MFRTDMTTPKSLKCQLFHLVVCGRSILGIFGNRSFSDNHDRSKSEYQPPQPTPPHPICDVEPRTSTSSHECYWCYCEEPPLKRTKMPRNVKAIYPPPASYIIMCKETLAGHYLPNRKYLLKTTDVYWCRFTQLTLLTKTHDDRQSWHSTFQKRAA